jgi:hypothetical protein
MLTGEKFTAYILRGSQRYITIVPYEEYRKMKFELKIYRVFLERVGERSVSHGEVKRNLHKLIKNV